MNYCYKYTKNVRLNQSERVLVPKSPKISVTLHATACKKGTRQPDVENINLTP